jgi:hypothetical protein
LGVTHIPNPVYITTITTTSQVTLQIAIAHHGPMPNNLDSVPTSINLSPQQLIVFITNILHTIDALAFANPMGECFRILELEFLVKNSEKKL